MEINFGLKAIEVVTALERLVQTSVHEYHMGMLIAFSCST
jgi:hypothetical protein